MADAQADQSSASAETKAPASRQTSAPGQNGAAPPQRKRSKIPLVILAIVVILAVAAGVWYYLKTKDIETTDDAQTDGNVVMMAPKVAGYVTDLNITDNQHVHAGDLLLRIDQRPYIVARDQARAQLETAQAQLESATVNLEITAITAPAKLTQAKAQRDSAAATRDNAMSDYRRQTGVDKRATTQQSIDQASTQVKSADAQLREDEAAIKIADTIPQTLSQAQAQVDQAKAQVDQARAQLADAELNLSYTEIRAPQAGFITRRAVQLGTFAQAGQTLFALVTDDLWVTANFKENQLDRMRVGQHVDMTLDAYSQVKLGGHIDSIQMGTGSRFSAFPSENATGNYVKIVQRVPVKIVIDTGLDPNHPLPLGLSVNPAVQLK